MCRCAKRVLSIMLLVCFAMSSFIITASAYTIQNNGVDGLYIDINSAPYTTLAQVPEWGQYAYGPYGCAWFASARAKELTGKNITTIYGGSNWYNNAYFYFGFSRSNVPQGKSLACWENHVAVIEWVYGDSVTISEGGYQYGNSNTGYCVIRSVKISEIEAGNNLTGSFLGYVYLGVDDGISSAPVNLWIELPNGAESSYKINEEFDISFGGLNANKFTFIIYREGKEYYEETFSSTTGEVTIKALFEKTGHYSGYIVAENSAGKTATSSWIGWDIVDQLPTNLEISIDGGQNRKYCVGDNITFSLVADGGWNKHIGIHREDGSLYKEAAISGNSYVTTIDETGEFYADFDAINAYGTTRSLKVYFEVTDLPPEYANLSINGTYVKEYLVGKTIRFTLSAPAATKKYIGVHKDGVFYYGDYLTEDYCDLTFNEPGEYYIDFDAINKFGTTRSNKIYITVVEHIHTISSWIIDKAATVNAAGSKHKECTLCGETVETATIAQLKCATPKLSKVANTASGVKFTWGAVEGADSYVVYRKTYNASTKKWGGWSRLEDDVTSTSYLDKTAKSGTYYLYTVRAENEAGLSGYNTSGIKTRFLATPKITSTANTNSGITVKWGKVSGATGYIVYRKSGNGGWQNLGKTTGTSFTDKKATAGVTYRYTIKAYYGSYVSAYNTNGSAVRRLLTPTLKSVTSAKAGVTLKWNKVTGATGYIVYRKTGNGSWQQLSVVKGNGKITYLDKTAKKGVTYKYTVRAYYGTSTSYYNTKGLTIKDKY